MYLVITRFLNSTKMASKVIIFTVLLISVIHLGRANKTSRLTEKSLVQSVNQFGSELLNGLYSNLAAEDNVLVSPVNAYAALALLHLGAAKETLKELSAVMKVSRIENATIVHERLNAILSQISPPAGSLKPSWRTSHETKLANGIFLQKNFSIKPTYKELAQKYYNSSADNLDFNGEPQKATDFINKWISESTSGRINKFYEQPLSSDTIAVLVSALYFDAKWKIPFPLNNTKQEKFNTGVKEIEVPMMNMEVRLYHSNDDKLHYASVPLFYAITMDHKMTIYLQHADHGDHGSLAHLFRTLAEQNFAPNTTETKYRRVNLKIPKMKFSWKDSVVSALNLQATFDAPNLDGMTSSKNVKVSNMIHATELEVDENGTIGSASTAVNMGTRSGSPKEATPVDFHVNRSFLMTISHRDTGTILFAGIVRKPIT